MPLEPGCDKATISRNIAELSKKYPHEQAVAIAYENCRRGKSMALVFGAKAELRRMLLISSNNFKDREQEIVRKKALDIYVKSFQPNPLLYWHGGEAIGEIVAAKMYDGFLVEVAKELSDAMIDLRRRPDEPSYRVSRRAVWDAIEQAPVTWGASIGFHYIKEDRQDGVYEMILKNETSILPLSKAANVFTFAQVMEG